MADFNVDFTPARGEGTSPLAPVTSHAVDTPSPWIGFTANAASLLLQTVKQNKELEKQQQIDQVVADFTREQTSINDAVSQGAMTQNQGISRARANFSKYAAQYPALVKHFKETNSALLENTDLSEMKEQEQADQDRERKLEADMVAKGYPITADMDPKIKEQFKATYLKTTKLNAEFEDMAKRATERRSQNAEDRSMADFVDKNDAVKALARIGKEHGITSIDFIQNLAANASTPELKTAAKYKLASYFATIENGIAGASGKFPEMATVYRSMFSDIKKLGDDAIDGKIESAALDTQLKDFKNRLQLAALAHPTMQAAYAENALIPNMVSTTKQTNIAAMDVMSSFINKGGLQPPVVGTGELEKDIYGAFQESVKKYQLGKVANPAKMEQQLSGVAENTLTQLEKALSNGLEGKDLTEVSKFIASPEFAFAMEKGLVNKEQAKNAKHTLQYLLENQITREIEGKFEAPFSTGLLSNANGRTYGDLVEIKMVGDGVKLDKKMNNPMNLQEMGERDRFIKELQPFNQALNLIIKAGAHLEGTRDYAAYWDEHKHEILPQMFKELEGPGKTYRMPESDKANFIPASDLQKGMELGGFVFLGGDPSKQSSWRKK